MSINYNIMIIRPYIVMTAISAGQGSIDMIELALNYEIMTAMTAMDMEGLGGFYKLQTSPLSLFHCSQRRIFFRQTEGDHPH